MSIVLNEYEWAERAISEHVLGKRPTETLSRIAKYYFANHYSKRDVRRLLDEFVLQCKAGFSQSDWSKILDSVVKSASKYPIIRLDGVTITKSELAKIEKLGGAQIQRLAFTLLCVAKYWDAARGDSNNHWVNCADNELMQMANINTSIKRQNLMLGELRDAGLITFARKVDSLNIQVLFSDDGEEELFVHDFRNLGYQYMKYCGGSYFECANCGLTTKMRTEQGRPQKYCDECAVEVRTRQNVNSVMRHRSALKS